MTTIGGPRCRLGLAAQMIMLATPLHAQTPPAANPLQADFDAASAAVAAGHCADAEPIFARLAVDPRIKTGSLPAAMIALRRGICRIAIGDAMQGEAWVREGLPRVEQAGPSMTADVADGWVALAHLAARNYDHDRAVLAYQNALALPGQGDRIDALTGLAMITSFDGDGVALPLADHALAIVLSAPAKRDRAKSEAQVRSVRARILMNLGRNEEASKEAEKALSLSGGLSTDKVSLTDVSLRSDAAEAALLNGRKDRARQLLAYTGAGRIAQSPFASATVMRVSDCDDSVGMRPTDSAVVEFSIADDGTVHDAQPVFTRGNYAIARAFAEAVRGWVWQPESVARLPPFYRALTRVELRCSKSGGGLPGVDVPFYRRIADWAAPLLGPLPQSFASGSRAADAVRERAGGAEANGDLAGAGTLLLYAVTLDRITRATQLADVDHAVVLLAGADAAHRATAAALRAVVGDRVAALQKQDGGAGPTARAAALLDAADAPDIAGDALSQDTVRLLALRAHWRGRTTDRELGVLRQVADDARLDAASPLRQVALLRLAGLAAGEGRHDEAEALYARTGLGEEQCALIGDIPRLRSGVSDSAYPVDALRMGFEGWVREEFDIAANGHTIEPRAVIAYPPFVFVEGATDMVRNVRYDPSFRPSGKLACSAKAETINFHIPTNH